MRTGTTWCIINKNDDYIKFAKSFYNVKES